MDDESPAAPTTYLSVVEDGTRRYLAHLRAVIGRTSGSPRDVALREVARPLTQALARVLETRRLSPGDLRLPSAPFVRGGGHPELLNPWSVGLGNPQAPVLVLSPEPVYGLDRPEFLLEGLLLQALWLADADVHVAASALEIPAWSEVPFQRYPNDYYRAPLLSAWGRLASLLALAWGGTARELLQPKGAAHNPAPHLFDDVYLLDLSTVPSDWRAHAAPTPVAEREAFLGALLSSIPDARLLLLQERPENPVWSGACLELAARFLGFPARDLKTCLQTERPTRTWDELRWFFHGEKGVLFTVPFSYRVEEDYWARAAELVQVLMPARPPPA